MKRLNVAFSILSLAMALHSGRAAAKTGSFSFSYGGQLLDSTGAPIKGPVNFEMKFYRQMAGGDAIPISPLQFANVPLTDGAFQIDVTQLTPEELNTVFDGATATWVEVSIAGAAYPRQQVVAVPFALKVPVDGKRVKFDAKGRLTTGPDTAAQANEFLTQDGNGDWAWSTPTVSAAPAASIAARPIDATVPTPGQVLRFDGASSTWKADSVLPPGGTTGQFLQMGASGVLAWATPGGGGNMMSSTWDVNNDGKVDRANSADQLNFQNPSYYLDFANMTGTVGAAQIAANAVGASHIAAGAVGSAQLSANAVTAAKIANGTITAAQIANATITATQLATGAVTGGNIGVGAVGTAQLAATSVDASKIVDGVINDVKIAPTAGIGRSKLALGQANSVVVNDGTGAMASVAVLDTNRGGTGTNSVSQGLVFAGPASGTAAPGFRALTPTDLPPAAAAGTVPGQIQFFASGMLGADSSFIWNVSSHALGIGTSTPNALVHAVSNGGVAAIEAESVSGGFPGEVKLKSGSTTFEVAALGGGNNFVIRDSVAAADRLTIDGAGNVGVGVSTPGAALDVAGDIHTGQGYAVVSNSSDRLKIVTFNGSTTAGACSGANTSGVTGISGSAYMCVATFAATFTSLPACTCTVIGSSAGICNIASVSSTNVTVKTFTYSGGSAAYQFSMQCIGTY